ncbi:hypothetical protein BKP64_08990 [Marinobacter salinus]|uniref:Uncharacterized protein n=1 Tax=Marinobacter salinus TaxID=1874317 RepID=A0A1D9GKX1_9GAMM|nr:hypothetical protein [Marinobacter salinus]AOY88288.1 hypothetical protein BKP64_08990 [Marinobacter salinus]
MLSRAVFSVFFLAVGSTAYSETHSLSCETIGFAYSHDKKVLYQSRKVHFWYESIEHCTFEGPNHHALMEWGHFFDSEVRDSYKYRKNVKTDCGCKGKRASGVSRKFQDVKKDFVRGDFEIRHLKGFYPENKEINSDAPPGQILLQY